MYKVLQKHKLAENTYCLDILANNIASRAQPGQFVMVKISENGKRIPLAIADKNKKSISLVLNCSGPTTQKLSKFRKGDIIPMLAGPLGNESQIDKYGTVCLVGSDYGIGGLYHVAKKLKESQNKLICILSAKSKKNLYWEDKYKEVADKLLFCTEDGTKGPKSNIKSFFEKIIRKERLNRIICMGPIEMMKDIAKLSKQRVKTMVMLNPIMVDGIGVCGSCKVIVDGQTKYACVDGPEFDAHQVDFESLYYKNMRYQT